MSARSVATGSAKRTSGTSRDTTSSQRSRPWATSCAKAREVIGFEIEYHREGVASVIGRPRSRSRQPCVATWARAPSIITADARPGTACSSATRARSASTSAKRGFMRPRILARRPRRHHPSLRPTHSSLRLARVGTVFPLRPPPSNQPRAESTGAERSERTTLGSEAHRNKPKSLPAPPFAGLHQDSPARGANGYPRGAPKGGRHGPFPLTSCSSAMTRLEARSAP